MRDFNKWFKTMRHGVTSWDYYTDFDKVYENLSQYQTEIQIINKIIHSDDIEKELKNILYKHPSVIKILPMIIATRKSKFFINNKIGSNKSQELEFDFTETNKNIDKFMTFAKKAGIINVLKNIHGNLEDYMFGIEVGMDTNARKNRSGGAMEAIVEAHLLNMGLLKDENYWSQVTPKKFKEIANIDLSDYDIKKSLRFDFVVKNGNRIFVIETNVYQGNGSKQGSIDSSYILRNDQLNKIPNVVYIWITDGDGWQGDKEGLKYAFSKIKHLFNLNDLEHGELEKIIRE